MYSFDRVEQEPPNTPIACDSCGWTGVASQANHLAGEPRCPNQIDGNLCNSVLFVLESGDEDIFDQ